MSKASVAQALSLPCPDSSGHSSRASQECPEESGHGRLKACATVAAILLVPGLLSADPNVTYLRDVAPILNKAGCTQGTCHGAAKGKNGFKLSLRGYDPQFDYEALLYDLSGRRFNRA